VRASAYLLVLACAAPAFAQEASEPLPPGHPPIEAAPEPLPSGHPPVDAGAGNRGQRSMADVLRPPEPARAVPTPLVPAGTIRVLVVDENDRPVPSAPVDVGVMASGQRSRHNGRTNAQGVATFADLPTGTSQAYRVNVPYQGATYSSAPFQLESDRGHDVRVVRLPVTRDDRYVFLNLYRVIVEIVEERFKVVHHAQITNAGSETYVFPQRGLRVPLPEGALAFQTEAVMTDQRVEELRGRHMVALRGSLPPGTVQLGWAYDIPIEGDTQQIDVPIPMRFFGLELFAQEAERMRFSVDGMPEVRRVETGGMAFWGTGLQRSPNDPEMRSVTMELEDIPGPGPLRWLAVLACIGILGLGTVLLLLRGDDRAATARAMRARRDALLAEASELEVQHASGEIGPEFRQKRRAAIVRELAALLREEDAAKRPSAAPSAPSRVVDPKRGAA
jgi:hypothetical protein